MAKTKEITASVGITKKLATDFEFIRVDIGVTKTVGKNEDEEAAFDETWKDIENQLMIKLRELHGDPLVNKELPK